MTSIPATEPAGYTRELQERIERLQAERDELQRKLNQERGRSAALLVDGDRRERRALDKLPDCEAHRSELQYLRHCVSWYWHAMNDTEEARHAIVGALGKTVLDLRRTPGTFTSATVKASDLVKWLEKAIDAQNRPLKRHGFPTLADCLRSAAGGCEHDGIAPEAKREIAEALGLGGVPAELTYSAETADRWRTPYATAADYATYAAARMNGPAGADMDDAEATADGDTVTVLIHGVPALRAVFKDV